MSWNPRTGGFAGLTAAGLLVLSAALQRFAPVDVYRTVAVVALATVVAAVAGVHTAHRGRPRYPPVGAVAAAVTGR